MQACINFFVMNLRFVIILILCLMQFKSFQVLRNCLKNRGCKKWWVCIQVQCNSVNKIIHWQLLKMHISQLYQNCKKCQGISHNVFTGHFCIWVYHNGDSDTNMELHKLKNSMKNIILKNLAEQILQLKNMKSKTWKKSF